MFPLFYKKFYKKSISKLLSLFSLTFIFTTTSFFSNVAQSDTIKKITPVKKVPTPSTNSTATSLNPTKPSCPNILKFTALRLQDEEPQALCQYAGKVVMVVNTATYCGFTGQYQELQQLQKEYKASGLVILGFPSNDFGDQEPGSNKQIASFCKNTYNVEFPMFAKSVVSGVQMNPFFKALKDFTGISPRWNFHKYLISRDGQKIQSFDSWQSPINNSTRKAVINALLQPNPYAK